MRQSIEKAFESIQNITPQNASDELKQSVNQVLASLNRGEIRVSELTTSGWQVNDWVKKAILLFFRINTNQAMPGYSQFYDKVPLKFNQHTEQELKDAGVRIVPPACVRFGAHIEPNTVLMPSYVNIGAYIGSGSMIDTWATVGTCAQIGKNVHLSGGAGIGGVLEPLQAEPTIIEDNCFIGARSEVVEGVIVEKNSVISMGVFIGKSTPIYDRQTKKTIFGRVPAGSVVVAGSLPGHTGDYHLNAAIIVKTVDEKTRSKTAINELLRGTYA